MGLGPPVCTDCKVFAELRDLPVLRSSWVCPMCGQHSNGHLWELPSDQYNLYTSNTKLVKFIKGVDARK